MTDQQQFPVLEGHYAELSFLPDSEEMRAIREGIQRIQRSQRIHSSEIVLRDFDFLNPRNTLQTHIEESRQHLQGVPLEWYDYAAGYTDPQHGESIARLRLEAIQSNGQLLSGESNATGLVPGRSFALVQHPDNNRNRGFKLISCDYSFVQDGPDSASQGRNVACKFKALNDDVVYRPQCVTPPPKVPGVQSATVSVRVNQKCIPISSPVFAFTFTGIVIKPPKMIAPAGSALYRRGPVKAGASWRCLGSGKKCWSITLTATLIARW